MWIGIEVFVVIVNFVNKFLLYVYYLWLVCVVFIDIICFWKVFGKVIFLVFKIFFYFDYVIEYFEN